MNQELPDGNEMFFDSSGSNQGGVERREDDRTKTDLYFDAPVKLLTTFHDGRSSHGTGGITRIAYSKTSQSKCFIQTCAHNVIM